MLLDLLRLNHVVRVAILCTTLIWESMNMA